MSKSLNIDLEGFNNLVGKIYDAALEPELWSNVLNHISTTLNTKSAILRVQDLSSKQVGSYVVHNLDPAYQKQYREHFVHVDALIPAVAKQPVGKIEQASTLMSESFYKGEFYNEFALPQGMEYTVGVVLMRYESQLAVMGYHRNHSRGSFNAEELSLFGKLIPHLQRALEVNRRLWEMDNGINAKQEILDRLALGVILVDITGKPVFLNKRAEDCICSGQVLTISKNTLRASAVYKTKELHRLIFEATRAELPQSGAMALSSSGLEQPLSLMVTPVGKEKSSTFQLISEEIAAAIFISCSQQALDLSLDMLCRLYGLTPAEARLATALANGESLESMAEQFSVSLHTIRTQLKSCFRKTGTKRQNELVKLVFSAPEAWLNSALQ